LRTLLHARVLLVFRSRHVSDPALGLKAVLYGKIILITPLAGIEFARTKLKEY
jgi:hypothetical protein